MRKDFVHFSYIIVVIVTANFKTIIKIIPDRGRKTPLLRFMPRQLIYNEIIKQYTPVVRGMKRMQNPFYTGLCLLAAQRFAGERSPQAVVHLLRGRKNNQVITDAALFGVSILYGIMQHRTNEEVRQEIEDAISAGWLTVHPNANKESIYCSPQGEEQLAVYDSLYNYEECLASISSVHDKVRAIRLWSKLQLLVQTLSHITQQASHFYPVIEDREIQQEVKQLLSQYPDRQELAGTVKYELSAWVEGLAPWEQQIILRRLSGKRKTGLTFSQIAELFGHAGEWAGMHLIRLVAERFPSSGSVDGVLSRLVDKDMGNHGLTATARQTKLLLAAGLTLEEIGKRRGLKRGTIEDHIVEIAIADPFYDVADFVTNEKIERVHTIMKETGTKKLGEIKRAAGADFSYLEIRLACARLAQEVKS